MIQKANPSKDSSTLDTQGLPARRQRLGVYMPQAQELKRTRVRGYGAVRGDLGGHPSVDLFFRWG